MQPVVWNRTVRACCRGWSGPHCTEGRDGHWGAVAPPAPPLGAEPAEQPVLSSGDDSRLSAAGEGSLGRCYGTWRCQDTASSRNLSAMSLAECCRHPWGHSWRNGSTASCLACTHLPLAGGSGAPRGLWGGPGWFCGARAEWHHLPTAGGVSPRLSPAVSLRGAAARHRGPRAGCLTWAGSRYRSFDGTHFHFSGECTYSLASAADGTWAVSIAAGDHRVPVPPAVGAAHGGDEGSPAGDSAKPVDRGSRGTGAIAPSPRSIIASRCGSAWPWRPWL